MDGIFQVTVAAEGCDYAALIMIVIFNQCRKVLFQQHEMNLMGTTQDTGPLLAAALKNEARILAGRH